MFAELPSQTKWFLVLDLFAASLYVHLRCLSISTSLIHTLLWHGQSGYGIGWLHTYYRMCFRPWLWIEQFNGCLFYRFVGVAAVAWDMWSRHTDCSSTQKFIISWMCFLSVFKKVSEVCEESSIFLLVKAEKEVWHVIQGAFVFSVVIQLDCMIHWQDEPGAFHVFHPELSRFSQLPICHCFSECMIFCHVFRYVICLMLHLDTLIHLGHNIIHFSCNSLR